MREVPAPSHPEAADRYYSAWYKMIGDSTHADAILDRLVHGSIKIELKGESMRK
ncbi:ATP-binding protein, partial [Escherichia coli]|uniref:ATP-binding protein n=1 Tax=Escherichia coli TaxID=562 RepID=UPI003EE1C077